MRRVILFLCVLSLTCSFFAFNNVQVYAKEKVEIPNDVRAYCEKYGEEYGVCPELIEALAWQETRCRPNLENEGCIGMCQINPKYHKAEMDLLGIDDLYDAEQNIHLCAYILRQSFLENEEVYYVLMCYNSGSSRGKELFEKGVVTSYAKEVSANSAMLERLHEEERRTDGRRYCYY